MIDKPWPKEPCTNPIRGTLGSILVFSIMVGAVIKLVGHVRENELASRSESAPISR